MKTHDNYGQEGTAIFRKLGILVVAVGVAMSVLTLTATPATGQNGRTTVIYSPHPDDETLRLSGYTSFAANRGDRLILVAVTDGGATGVRHWFGYSSAQMEAVRRSEQELAWAYLTAGKGEVIRLGLPDGQVSGSRHAVSSIAQELEQRYGPDVEHYVAARLDDSHADHRAVAEAVRDSGVRVVRYARPAGEAGGTKYLPPAGWEWAAAEANEAYHGIGHRSVRAMFEALSSSGAASHITAK